MSVTIRGKTTIGPSIVTNGLVLYLDAANNYSYPQPQTGTIWYDISGNNFNGTLYSAITFDNTYNGSLVFNGILNMGSNVQFSQSINLAQSDFTFSSWFRSHDVSGSKAIISLATGGYGAGLYTWYVYPSIQFSAGYSNPYAVTGSTILSNNIWYNLVGIRNGTNIYIYSNGILDGAAITPDVYNFGAVSPIIGRMRSGQHEFDGNISVCYIYNRALTAAEVLRNYNATKGRYGL